MVNAGSESAIGNCGNEQRRARLIQMIAAALALSFAVSAGAQKETITIANWRVQTGDSPDWARPDFDDSNWPMTTFRDLNSFNDPGGTRWYRATFQVPADFAGQELAVGMGPLDQVYEVYINGTPVGHWGSWEPNPHAPFPRHLAFPLSPGLLKGSVGNIAIRRWRGGAGLSWVAFSLSGNTSIRHSPEIGPKGTIEMQERLHPAVGAIRQLPWTLTYVLFLFSAAISFVLFSVQRRRAEYLYLGLFCLFTGGPPLVAIPLSVSNSVMAQSWGPVLTFFFNLFGDVFSFLFLACLCQRYKRVLQFGAVLAGILALAAGYSLAEQSHAATLLWQYGGTSEAVFDVVAARGLFQERRRGSFAIAFALLLNALVWAWDVAATHFHLPRLSLTAGPFHIDLRSLFGVLFVLVTLLVLYLRYRDEQARQSAIDQDLAAARRMQKLLLAGCTEKPAGFAVQTAYRPAREVGGDFYRAVSLEDGSLLVIVGDVSGKGLDAAMLVAVILGSLANETHRSPASLLAYLNRAVIGQTGGGFITACCARFYPDGRVVLANAGHIAPYVDEHELESESGLPLGIIPEASYTETEVRIDAAVTFVSDGVVEARGANGELLGFDRIGALTARPAEEIADAAQRWGQEDDITVLTVVRTTMPLTVSR